MSRRKNEILNIKIKQGKKKGECAQPQLLSYSTPPPVSIGPFGASVVLPVTLADYVSHAINPFPASPSVLLPRLTPRSNATFGGIYSPPLPSVLIPSSYDRVTPMVSAGDIGTIFEAVGAEGVGVCKPVKVKGLGVGRFKVDRVISNGYDYFFDEADESRPPRESSERRPCEKKLPYILCECSWYDDVEVKACEHSGSIREKVRAEEKKLLSSMMRLEDLVEEMWRSPEGGCGKDVESDESYLSAHRFSPLSCGEYTVDSNNQRLEKCYNMPCSSSLLPSWSSSSLEVERSLLFSMSVATSLTDGCDVSQSEARRILECRSVVERMQTCRKIIEDGTKWIGARKILKDMLE